VWNAGISVQVGTQPLRIIRAQFSGEEISDARIAPDECVREMIEISAHGLRDVLNLEEMEKPFRNGRLQLPRIKGTRPWMYRYKAANRFDDANELDSDETEWIEPSNSRPTLPIPPVPDSIVDGNWHLVAEARFTLYVEKWGLLNWTVLIEPETRAVLYLRALVDNATALIFPGSE
jgi:hypothetical protein